jgi:hypothetical protein
VEYTAGDLVGRYLRKHTNLNTIDEITKRQREPMGKVVAKLASQLQAKNQHVQDLETKTNATEFSIARLEADNRKLHEEYNEGTLCCFVFSRSIFFQLFYGCYLSVFYPCFTCLLM